MIKLCIVNERSVRYIVITFVSGNIHSDDYSFLRFCSKYKQKII